MENRRKGKQGQIGNLDGHDGRIEEMNPRDLLIAAFF
jgi:hypothetical protein